MKVYVLDEMHLAGLAWLSERTEVIRWDDPRCAHWHDDAQGVMVRAHSITGQDFQQARHLKVVSKQGVGVNRLDLEAARACGVTVCNTPGINRVAVAEMAMALVLNLARRVTQQDRLIRQGVHFNRNHFLGLELTGKTVGVIGMGNTGTEFARMMQAAFRARILAYAPRGANPGWADIPHQRASHLDELWPQCDVVSLHVPYHQDNHHLVNARALAMMKPTALLVNVSRGGLVDEAALFEALQRGHLAGAALDAWEETEPPASDHPLLQLPQVIATPHAAGSTTQTQAASSLAVAQQLWHVLNGGEPYHRVV
ncbi:MAG: hydroxyacid dehydrogenase [Limnohabitans sp.]|nr:hydroxyacid dehydrogenase [Limnohabitans sp.]